jgi:hypothetical protein
MTGYILVEQSQLATHKVDGITPHPQVYGILDFLRELAEDNLQLRHLAKLRVVGLDEVLFAARPNDHDLALAIHQKLRKAASDLERRQISVQLVFTSLKSGHTLWAEYRNEKLPIDLIFGSPPQDHDGQGNRLFRVAFSLTH